MKEKKLLYIWEPIYNKTTIVTKDYFKELIGNKKSISSYIANAIKKETYLPLLKLTQLKEYSRILKTTQTYSTQKYSRIRYSTQRYVIRL